MSTATLALWRGVLGWLDHPASEARAYSHLRVLPQGRDVSLELDALFHRRALRRASVDALFAPIAARLRAAQVLFVPAYLSGSMLRGPGLAPRFGYLNFLLRRLSCEGIQAAVVEIDSAATVEANALHIAEHIRAAQRPIFLVTHSKGGLDALHTLVTNPELRAKVEGFAAYQAPFFGSPIADVACTTTRARSISASALKLFRGKLDAAHDLTTMRRAAYMSEFAGEIRETVATCPTLCIATKLASAHSIAATIVRRTPSTRWMCEQGLPNDGLVPVASAVLPGARYAIIDGMMHDEPGSRHPLFDHRFDRLDLLKAALALASRP